MIERKFYPTALTIAGSDSGGGAGIQADLRTFSAFGVFGCSAITAITAQNPHKVAKVEALSPEMVASQITTVTSAINIDAVKVGMLANLEIVQEVNKQLKDKFKNSSKIVIDPVMISTSKVQLLSNDCIDFFCEEFLYNASWLTPNIFEAERLTNSKISSEKDMIEVAKFCADKWQCSCIIKGGHSVIGDDERVNDIICHNNKILKLGSPFIDNCEATHGTGCTFSSAIAAGLALDLPWKKTLKAAKDFVFGSIADAVPIGENTEAMYPPQDSFSEEIDLKAVKN
ncbi:bifunctional hydroxymethylpyrimidine kinase/phosphomethylpyrimidine kinase [Lentisphaerota bacterium WC36G]|nr:bifunctional hydroxymethylpyrimidine kinase/phosphomethylpyrimidine kinase [Lentisphaerae bacterium WC36]